MSDPRYGKVIPLSYGSTTLPARVVYTEPEPEVRLSMCERCGSPEVMRATADGMWSSRHVCRPNDLIDWRVLAAGVLGSALVVTVVGALVALAIRVLA